MVLLPIVGRELRVASRRGGTYWIRVTAAGMCMLAAGWMLLLTMNQPVSMVGRQMFYALSFVLFVVSTLAGPVNTSDSLTSEKREGTLGLLFLTDLRGYDVVFGKVVATSFKAVLAMLATVPILCVPLLLGGVTLAEWGRVATLCANTTFLSLAFGLLASTFCSDDRKAMGMTILALLVVALGVIVMAAYLHETGRVATQWPAFVMVSPAFAFGLGMGAPGPSGWGFWDALAVQHALGWICLGIASVWVGRSWQERGWDTARRGLLAWLGRLQHGVGETRRQHRLRLLSQNAVLWLAGRNRIQGPMVWGFLALSTGLWLWGWWKNQELWLDTVTYLFTATVLNTILKIWVVSESCRCFAEARRVGAMELVLTTPQAVAEVVRGQCLALWRQFGRPALCVLAANAACYWAGTYEPMSNTDLRDWNLTYVAGIVVLIVDLVALPCVGMWYGLRLGRANRAMGRTIGLLLVMPWALFVVGVGFVGALSEAGLYPLLAGLQERDLSSVAATVLWLGLSLGISMGFGLRSWRKLNDEFRAVCATPIGGPAVTWWRWVRRLFAREDAE